MLLKIAVILMSAALLLSACSEKQESVENSSAMPAAETQIVAESLKDVPIGDTLPKFELVKTLEGFASPEAVISDGEFFYVSNVGADLKPTEKDGDGFISKLAADGSILELKFLPKDGQAPLHAPKGMFIYNNNLYVADIDRIARYDLTTGAEQPAIDLSAEGVTFLNDFVALSAGQVLVTDTTSGRVFQLHLDLNSYAPVAIQFPGANGLAFEASTRQLFVLNFGRDNKKAQNLMRANLLPKGITGNLVSIPEGYYDGAYLQDKWLYASDWGDFKAGAGQIVRIDTSAEPFQVETLLTGLSGPARFYVDPKSNQWWIPNMLGNSVSIYAAKSP